MKKLRVSPDLSLPLDVVTTTIAVLGIRNSGKTNTCVVLTEELLDAGQQVVIIDPTDVWWGLKSSKDGKEAGYPIVVFGGRHGDVPLTAADGATVADFIVEERLPAILSLRHFESQNDMRRFVTDFARRLYHRKGEEGRDTPMLLVVDEAHLFVPQRVGGAEAQMVGAMQKLVRQGRSSGIGVAIIDQRAASVNKDILTQVELLICHRTTSPHDSRALEDWIEQNDTEDKRAEFLKKLPELKQGTAWCWSPGWLKIFELAAVRERHTFDSSATPKVGEKRVTPTTLAHVDLGALKKKMAEAIEKASAEDPRALRARIAQLERQLAVRAEDKPIPPPEKPLLSRYDAEVVRQTLETLTKQEQEILQSFQDYRESRLESDRFLMETLKKWLAESREPRTNGASKVLDVPVGSSAWKRIQMQRETKTTPASVPPDSSSSPSNQKMEMKILGALDQGGPMNRKKLAIWTGYSHTSGSFGQALADLRANGSIAGSSKEFAITSAGRSSVAGHAQELPTGEALLEWWIARRPASDGLVLRALADNRGPMSRVDIAKKIVRSNTSGSYGQTLADLRALGLIEGDAKSYELSPQLVDNP
ncbi:MAG TPA: helicase HerA-like domain-containing protein [Thermoanaerobaculia bacterium]|nr:helicase HerA-like domain-containing protein [Thermoanaerobaculia bacterium]